MQIEGSVALVTGANRGIGRHFAQQLIERGAAKVYATARDPSRIDLPGVEALALDITDAASVASAAEAASDVTLLVNNAGIATGTSLIEGDLATIHSEMDTHYFGTLSVIRAFAPVLAANGGGAILNMLSVVSWFQFQGSGAYGAAKAAQWALTDSVRLELADQGTQVVGLHVGAVDTEMMAGYDVPKNDPAAVARAGLDGIQAGAAEVLADDASAGVKAGLGRDPLERYGLTSSA